MPRSPAELRTELGPGYHRSMGVRIRKYGNSKRSEIDSRYPAGGGLSEEQPTQCVSLVV